MPSAFRRAGGAKAASKAKASTSLLGVKGVKPWTGGIHLTSVGVNDLDIILGGGQPLGTCILLQEDRWTRDLALSLVKYWCAEAVSQEQDLVIPVSEDSSKVSFRASLDESEPSYIHKEPVRDLLLSLPRNLHWDKQKKKEQAQPAANQLPQPLDILEEEDEEKAEEGLEIAWQYKKSVQQERLALAQPTQTTTNNVFCHSYDLSGRMNEQKPVQYDSSMVPMANKTSGLDMFRDLVSLTKGKEGQAIRLLLFHPNLDCLVSALPLFLAHVRSHSLPVVVMICTPPSPNMQRWTQLARTADVVLSTEGFASRKEYPPPAEFRHLHGLLTISKVSTVTAATANGGGHFADLTVSKRPTAYLYGVKRDRRKLHIPLLHIPPEDYAEGGGSVGSGVRSGGGKIAESKSRPATQMGCSSNQGSVLDF